MVGKWKLFFMASLSINLFLLALLAYSHFHEISEEKRANTPNYDLLSPFVAAMEVNEFLRMQRTLTLSFSPLKSEIENILRGEKGTYGVYVEDLTTGAWMGINERGQFYPASLVKVPYLIAALKKVEMGEIGLDSSISLAKKDLDSDSGELYTKGENYSISLLELLAVMIEKSDNTAFNALARHIAGEDIGEALYSMGVIPESNQDPEEISPKQYSSIFRSLYYSTYVRRYLSMLALSLMENTIYDAQIESGLPDDIRFSHKSGVNIEHRAFHDCGIVYLPEKPYMICVMSTGASWEESREVMSRISASVYSYMSDFFNQR